MALGEDIDSGMDSPCNEETPVRKITREEDEDFEASHALSVNSFSFLNRRKNILGLEIAFPSEW